MSLTHQQNSAPLRNALIAGAIAASLPILEVVRLRVEEVTHNKSTGGLPAQTEGPALAIPYRDIKGNKRKFIDQEYAIGSSFEIIEDSPILMKPEEAFNYKEYIDSTYGLNKDTNPIKKDTNPINVSLMTDDQVIQMVESQTWKSLNTEDRELLATRASEMSYFQSSENRGSLDKFVATLMLHRVIEADRQRDK